MNSIKILFLVLLACGCNREYTTETEYVENRTVDPEKGWVKDYKVTAKYHWD